MEQIRGHRTQSQQHVHSIVARHELKQDQRKKMGSQALLTREAPSQEREHDVSTAFLKL